MFTTIWEEGVGRDLGCNVFLVFTLLLRSTVVSMAGRVIVPSVRDCRRYSISRTHPIQGTVRGVCRFCSMLSYRVNCDSLSRIPASGGFVELATHRYRCGNLVPPSYVCSSRRCARGPTSPVIFCVCKREGVLV